MPDSVLWKSPTPEDLIVLLCVLENQRTFRVVYRFENEQLLEIQNRDRSMLRALSAPR